MALAAAPVKTRHKPHLDRQHATRPPSSASRVRAVEPLAHLQGAVGNRHMHRLLQGLPMQARRDPAAAGRPFIAPVQRTCAGCEDERERPPVQAQRALGAAQGTPGLPSGLRHGLEQLSGFDLSGVRVHLNSSQPAALDALAYAQGSEIHVAPGQERHLAHEGWHVVQQLQGRVRPTLEAGGVSMNTDPRLEREAEVMGTREQSAGDNVGGAFGLAVATEDGRVLDEQDYVTGFKRPAAAVVQRRATFTAGTVSATTNLAASLLAGNFQAGFTPPTLNGTPILSTADARGAIRRPTLGGRSNADGTADAWVQTVPTNEASFTMQLATNGPWFATQPKTTVAGLFAQLGGAGSVPAGCLTTGDSTPSVHRRPSDAAVATAARTHENLHARDHRVGFIAVMIPWDVTVRWMQGQRRRLNGATPADAEAALWTAVGGTPDDIADLQHTTWINANNATHAAGTTLATGGPATPSNFAANATCTTASLDLS